MKQNGRPLFDHWLWEPPMLRAFVAVAIAIPVTCCVLMFAFGYNGLFALVFLCFAPLFGFGYGFVGKKIARLRDAISPVESTVIPGLIVKGIMESAGIVVLGQGSLILQPMVGKRSTTKLSEVISVREVSCFNGSVL